MKKSKAMKIIEKTALQHGVSVAEVRRDMQTAIDHAYENRGDSMPEFWGKWRDKPSVEQFLMAANAAVLDRLYFGGSK